MYLFFHLTVIWNDIAGWLDRRSGNISFSWMFVDISNVNTVYGNILQMFDEYDTGRFI